MQQCQISQDVSDLVMIVAEQHASHGQRLIVIGRGFVVVSMCEVIHAQLGQADGYARMISAVQLALN